ncbi:MAG TPA: carbon monoxide dehydrogenase beta subunit family protein [Methanoregulaceae archaeon]|nr:carbon monoxide dehydrogenase beta subunit family protein [Methanoregulaceae archaeon]HQJ87088.1 carbon monoxide dehydrogenase beta subunit family protein [Methanoregulaceae archaeon]
MNRSTPGQPAMLGGTRTATVIEKPAVLAALVRRSVRPLLVVGHRALLFGGDGELAVDLLARWALRGSIPVAATGDTAPALRNRGVEPARCVSAVNLAQRLVDPGWTGIDGAGPHDVVFIAGLSYALEWTLLSGLRHGTAPLVTVSLSPAYEPHASFSLPNLSWSDWRSLIIEALDLGEETP